MNSADDPLQQQWQQLQTRYSQLSSTSPRSNADGQQSGNIRAQSTGHGDVAIAPRDDFPDERPALANSAALPGVTAPARGEGGTGANSLHTSRSASSRGPSMAADSPVSGLLNQRRVTSQSMGAAPPFGRAQVQRDPSKVSDQVTRPDNGSAAGAHERPLGAKRAELTDMQPHVELAPLAFSSGVPVQAAAQSDAANDDDAPASSLAFPVKATEEEQDWLSGMPVTSKTMPALAGRRSGLLR